MVRPHPDHRISVALSCANDSCRHPQLLTGSVVQARSCPLGAAASRVGGVVVDFAGVHDDADPQLPVRAVAGRMSALYSASSLPRVGTGFESVLAEWPTLAGSRYSGVRWCPRSSSSRSLAPGPRWQAARLRQAGRDAMETGFALSEIDTTPPHPARMYSLNNQYELEGLDVFPDQGNRANTRGQGGPCLTSSSEEEAGDLFRTGCPLSAAPRSRSRPLRHVDCEIPVRVVTHAKVAQPSDLQQCLLVQVNRYDALLGGKDSYAADRRAVRQLLRAASEALDSARANRAFLQRAVRYLAGEAGIRQIIVTIASTVTVGHGSAGCERECERRAFALLAAV